MALANAHSLVHGVMNDPSSADVQVIDQEHTKATVVARYVQ